MKALFQNCWGRDMELDISFQILNFARSLLFGFAAFVLFDMFRLIRSLFHCGTFIVFIQDFLYFFVTAVAALIFVFAINDGDAQLYILGGIFLGWTVGYCTYGRLTNFVIKKCRKQQ